MILHQFSSPADNVASVSRILPRVASVAEVHEPQTGSLKNSHANGRVIERFSAVEGSLKIKIGKYQSRAIPMHNRDG